MLFLQVGVVAASIAVASLATWGYEWACDNLDWVKYELIICSTDATKEDFSEVIYVLLEHYVLIQASDGDF